jgi:hypothetical protein
MLQHSMLGVSQIGVHVVFAINIITSVVILHGYGCTKLWLHSGDT